MISRRITAGAAAVALAGTAFAAAPAMAKSNTTTLVLDAGLVQAIQAGGGSVAPVKPAKMKGTTLTFAAKRKGSTITHKGGFSIVAPAATLTLTKLTINGKNGKVTATATAPLPDPIVLENVLQIKGGKGNLAKGSLKNGTLSLAKSFTFAGQKQDPSQLISSILQIQVASGQKIGKITVNAK